MKNNLCKASTLKWRVNNSSQLRVKKIKIHFSKALPFLWELKLSHLEWAVICHSCRVIRALTRIMENKCLNFFQLSSRMHRRVHTCIGAHEITFRYGIKLQKVHCSKNVRDLHPKPCLYPGLTLVDDLLQECTCYSIQPSSTRL